MLWKWSHKKKAGVAVVAGIALLAGSMGVYHLQAAEAEEADTLTKETQVQYGNLTVGITESGKVSINSLTQSFPLDNAGGLVSDSSSDDSTAEAGFAAGEDGKSAAGGGMQAGGGTQSTGSSGSTTDSDVSLVVEKVYVSEGQAVKKGERLLKLTSESVKEMRSLYQDVYEEAEESIREARLAYQSDSLTAKYEYEQKLAKGESAKNTYQAAIASLQADTASKKAAYQEAKKGVAKLPAQIQALKKKLRQAKKVSGGVETAGTQNDRQNTSDSAVASATASEKQASDSDDTVSGLEQLLLQRQQQLQQYQTNLSSLKTAYHTAKKAETTGRIEARSAYEQALLDSKNAKTVYQTETAALKEELAEAKEAYKEAKKAKEKFARYIKKDCILAEYSATLVSLGYQEGDSLTSETAVATYQDPEGVTVTVSVSQEDITEIQVGDAAKVSLSAYEDEVFSGNVTAISTTASGESTVSYPVEVTITSDISKIYSDMSCEVTFVSKEVENVLYVSNKAVTTEGTASYVNLWKEDGSAQRTKVVTGFSDGHNVEIKSGLKEGDSVLIESQVSR